MEGTDTKVTKEKIEDLKKDFNVTVDMSVEDVLSLDKDGVFLVFDSDPRQFIDLGEEYKELSEVNRLSYVYAKQAFIREKRSRDRGTTPTPNLQVYGEAASATDLTFVDNRDPNFEYAWKRADGLPVAQRKGWIRVEKGDSEQTFNELKSVGKAGYTELVLMKTPKENYKKIRQIAKERSDRMRGAVENDGKGQLEKLGAKAKILKD